MNTDHRRRQIARTTVAAQATMSSYAASSVLLPIALVTISRELGINLSQGGLLPFITAFEQMAVLLASGFLAAHLGKLRLLRAGTALTGIGLLAFTGAGGFAAAVGFMLIVGLGQSLLEALLTPLVEDLHPGDDGSKMNLLHAFWPIGVAIGVLVFGELLTRGVPWRMIFAGLGSVIFLITLLYPRPGHLDLPKSRADLGHVTDLLRTPRMWLFGFALFFAGGAEGGFAFWTASYIQLEFGAVPRAGAIGTAAFALGMILGRLTSSRVSGRFGLRRILMASALLALAASGLFFVIDGLVLLYAFMVLMGFSIAAMWPSIQSRAGAVLGFDPTLVMIGLSCFGIPGYSSSTLVMGIIGDAFGLKASFVVAPVYLLVLVLLLLADGRIERRRSSRGGFGG